MEDLCASSTASEGTVSPPPSGASERVGMEEGSPESIIGVQLASRASHLTLSSSGSEAKGSRTRVTCMDSNAFTTFPTACSSAAAQPFPEIAQDYQNTQGWRKGAIVTPMGVFVPASPTPSHASGPWTTEMQTDLQSVTDDSGVPVTEPSAEQAMVRARSLLDLPNEVLLQILSNLDVCDLLATSRTTHHLRNLSLSPHLQRLRLRRTRALLPPLLTSPSRPSLADLIRRSIFLTNTTVVSRKLARSLVAIRLQRRLAARPSPEALVERCVLPPECLPYVRGYHVPVAPALVAKRRAVERERVKDGLRRWVGNVWKGEVRSREERVRRWEERAGIGRVWKLRRFWERVAHEGR